MDTVKYLDLGLSMTRGTPGIVSGKLSGAGKCIYPKMGFLDPYLEAANYGSVQ